jgi:arylformamidase
MDRAELDAAYNNSAAVPNVDAIRAEWDVRSARVRQTRRGHLDLEYGDTPRQRLDLFLADNARAPTLMFIHGGYWQRNEKERFTFLAEGPLARGINVAVVEYTLAPDARVDRIVCERFAVALVGSPDISPTTAPIRCACSFPAIRRVVT